MKWYVYEGSTSRIRAGGLVFEKGRPVSIDETTLTPCQLKSFAAHNVVEFTDFPPVEVKPELKSEPEDEPETEVEDKPTSYRRKVSKKKSSSRK